MTAERRPKLLVSHGEAVVTDSLARSDRERVERRNRELQALVQNKPPTPAKSPPKRPAVEPAKPPRPLPRLTAAKPATSPPAAAPDGSVVVSREGWGAISRMIDAATGVYTKGQKR